MEVINRDFRELGICKQDAADKARWKRLIGPTDRSMLDDDESLVTGSPRLIWICADNRMLLFVVALRSWHKTSNNHPWK